MRVLKREDMIDALSIPCEFDCVDEEEILKETYYVSVSVLRKIIKDLISENGFVANHEDDKDCGNKTYATYYDVVEIEDIKKAFGVLE